MATNKQGVNFSVNRLLADRFREATKDYYGKLGLCFSAAMLMFLEADPKVQGQYIKRIFEAEVDDEVESTIESAKEAQLKRIRTRGGGSKSKPGSP